MSKSVMNPRNVYKIKSSRFKFNNWDLKLLDEEAKKNEEIVSLGDSETLRMIRLINNDKTTEADIKNIKKNIERLKSEKNSKDNKEKIKELYQELDKKTFIRDYLLIMFESIEDWNEANKKKTKVQLNGVEYVRLLGTSAGIKNSVVVFVNKNIHEDLDRRLNNGRNEEIQYVPEKFESYKALSCTASTPVTHPKKVLVVKDGETKFNADILRLHDDENGGFKLDEVNDYEITRAFTDGCGMIDYDLAKQWTIDVGEFIEVNGEKVAKYVSSGFNCRNAFVKGMLFNFPFKEYAREIGEYMVEDCWGQMHNIEEVDLILTTNMLKLWQSYSSIDDYLSKCNKNGFNFCVAKTLPDKLETTRNMNYQFLQSYELSNNDIIELIKPTVDLVKGAIGYDLSDYGKVLLFLKGNKITSDDFEKEEFNYIKALMLNKSMMNDPFIKQKVLKMIKKKIDDSKKGVIQVSGNYQIVSGDLYALCQFMHKKEVTGLLNANEFYSYEWLTNRGVSEVVAYRAPMTIHNNIVKMKFVSDERMEKYYRHMKTCIVLNAWDTTMDAMNGMDLDGDAVITTDNPILLRNTKKMKTVICEQKSTSKQKIKNNLLIKANKNGFGNAVGGVTNRGTAMYEVLASLSPGTEEYEIMLTRITCMQGYQQEIIDSCKGIIPKQVPKDWYDYKSATESSNPELNLRLLANKKPYFFVYNYKHLKNKLNKYVKSNDNSALIRFGGTVEEIRVKEDKTDKENEFIRYFDELNPISNNGSTMNKICNKLEEEFEGISTHVKNSNFDESIFMTDKAIKKELLKELEDIYKDYSKGVYQFMANNKNVSSDEKKANRSVFIEKYIQEVYNVCNNNEDVCNALVKLLYNRPTSKQFVWEMCGDYIINKLKKDNNDTISYPVEDSKGDIEWCGKRYTLITNKIEESDK